MFFVVADVMYLMFFVVADIIFALNTFSSFQRQFCCCRHNFVVEMFLLLQTIFVVVAMPFYRYSIWKFGATV